MIANSLDAGITLTAAQVSRILKQLDLCPLGRKKNAVSIHLRDELDDSFNNDAHDSDNVTLSALRKR